MSTYTCGSLPSYLCQPCFEPEKGRVRHLALVRKGTTAATAIAADPANATAWTNGITAGTVRLILNVRGTRTGEPVQSTGYGEVPTKTTSNNVTITFTDDKAIVNMNFYNQLQTLVSLYELYYVTDTRIWRVSVIADFGHTGAQITENVTDDVTVQGTFTFSTRNHELSYAEPEGIFDGCDA